MPIFPALAQNYLTIITASVANNVLSKNQLALTSKNTKRTILLKNELN
jgi:hypothetical protein